METEICYLSMTKNELSDLDYHTMVSDLINSRKGDLGRLEFILKCLQENKPLYKTDEKYLKTKYMEFKIEIDTESSKKKNPQPKVSPSDETSDKKHLMIQYETVSLNDMDGFGFEQLCARILNKAGWGHVELMGGVADGGRDIIVTRDDGSKTVIECKHYLNSTVGRPIIQKLHSAVITSHAQYGIVITTGKFSNEAIDHAKILSEKHHKMELYDMNKLVELAASVGIQFSDDNIGLYSYPIPEINDLKQAIFNEVKIISHPAKIEDIVDVDPRLLKLVACYLTSIDIVQDFKTSLGIIHSINKHGMHYFFNAVNGKVLLANTEKNTKDVVTELKVFHEPSVEYPIQRTDFKMDNTTLKNIIVDTMISEHSKLVEYSGKTRRVYKKICKPNKSSIRINDIKQIFLPQQDFILSTLRCKYKCSTIRNSERIVVRKNDFAVCVICKNGASTSNYLQICNECGMVTHEKKSHGFRCHECAKTVCRKCVLYKRRFLFFKRNFCNDCNSIKEGSHKYNELF